MPRVYIYVVDRDFGFAPNPFHGYCTLATCKPLIRRKTIIGDWVFGMGGARLKATGRCVFAMLVTGKISFDEYWSDSSYLAKKPVRNGSRKMMVGDNIYHRDSVSGQWCQADSHHSNSDGTSNSDNLKRDTKSDQVLVSCHFYYFGMKAPAVPTEILQALGYENRRKEFVFDAVSCGELITWLETTHQPSLNMVSAPPFDFKKSQKRYSGVGSKLA